MFEALMQLAILLESLDAVLAQSLGALERLLLRIGVFVVFVYGLWMFLKVHWPRHSSDSRRSSLSQRRRN